VWHVALGARRSHVLYLVLRESFQIAAIGTASGVPLALIAGHLMGSMLYQLAPYDKLSFLAAFAGIVGISLAAGYIPARRAASIDPVRALRSE
jgi:ABC-type antimicrobial peptide transport system permease subunit